MTHRLGPSQAGGGEDQVLRQPQRPRGGAQLIEVGLLDGAFDGADHDEFHAWAIPRHHRRGAHEGVEILPGVDATNRSDESVVVARVEGSP